MILKLLSLLRSNFLSAVMNGKLVFVSLKVTRFFQAGLGVIAGGRLGLISMIWS